MSPRRAKDLGGTFDLPGLTQGSSHPEGRKSFLGRLNDSERVEFRGVFGLSTTAVIAFDIPYLRVKNIANATRQGRWWAAAKDRREQRTVTAARFPREYRLPTGDDEVWVWLTRQSSGHLDDDGLALSFKSVRDAIAEKLAIDDGSAQIRFSYRQEKTQRGFFGVRVEIAIFDPRDVC